MKNEPFWRITSFDSTASDSTTKLADWTSEVKTDGPIICRYYPDHQRGGARMTNLSIVLPARKVEDFVSTWGSDSLIQDRVLQVFRANNFTGYEIRPAKARFRRGKEVPPRLHELVITGWAGVAGPESGIRLIEHCEGCGHITYSGASNPNNLINPAQWDGSDFFMVWPLPKYIFVTDRVKRVICENKLTGVFFRSVDSLDLSGGFSPGRLSYYMPEPRAES